MNKKNQSSCQPSKYKLLGGVSQTIVTPDSRGTFLIGPMQPSTGINDELWARVLVLSDGRNQIAILTLDYLGFDFAYNDVLIETISQSSGIPAANIMINCSHTHSAPITIPWGPWEKGKNKSFHHFLPKRLAEITKKAISHLEPVSLRYCRESTQIGFNRRHFDGHDISMAPNPSGATLPWVDVLLIEKSQGKPLAILFSHAAHPVIVHGASTLITADYPGFAVKTLENEIGTETLYMFAQGCSANINGFPLRGGINAAKGAGRDLGTAVYRAFKSMGEEVHCNSIQTKSIELELSLHPPPTEKDCQKLIEIETDSSKRKLLLELLTFSQSNESLRVKLPIRGFCLGDLCILGLAHEIFAEYHHFINQISPFSDNMVFAYTNGVECYVGTQADYDLGNNGGYETSPMGASLLYQPRLPLSRDSEAKIKDGLKNLLNLLKNKRTKN